MLGIAVADSKHFLWRKVLYKQWLASRSLNNKVLAMAKLGTRESPR